MITLSDAIRAADGVIFRTPEYNFSLPGELKNAIDWVSRLPNQPFAGKPIAIQSASPGPLGGGRVQYDLRRAMVFLDALTLNKPEIFIGSCASKFDDKTGELKEARWRAGWARAGNRPPFQPAGFVASTREHNSALRPLYSFCWNTPVATFAGSSPSFASFFGAFATWSRK